ncbi:restriction endonuclease subunit S [Aneurinibacillus aneurinilyticus]|uniref:restriction endonuclease subunit S n=1 Tax=Aneurinibacillus aneurinilyticus TaxID=1391 RepID=UPI002E1D15C4|nr:restriction endonuclease subunit S [Aneurinibacillus aneurinilyticus]MED0673760.1 restriction endonuclease subunit S [Aneurinibacillus aneurinilyticus]
MSKKKTLEELLKEVMVPESEQFYLIPNNWSWVKIGYISDVVGGGTPKSTVSEYYAHGDIPWITPADLSGYEDIYISRGKRNITAEGLNNSSARLMPKDTILFSSRAPIGYVAIASNELCTNQGFKSFLPSKAYITRYGYWYLKFAKSFVEKLASGTTFPEISSSKAAKIPFPLPPLPEQKRIVERVESLLGRAEELKQLIDQTKIKTIQRRTSVLAKVFRGQLTEEWRRRNNCTETADDFLEYIQKEKKASNSKKKAKGKKDSLSVFNEPYKLPEGWKWIQLAEIIESSTYGTSAKTNDSNDGIPVLRMGNIKAGEIITENLKYLPNEHPDIQTLTLEENDLLFNRTNSYELVGKTGIVRKEIAGKMTFASYLVRIRLYQKDLLAPYVCAYINSNEGRKLLLAGATQQVGQANINPTKLSYLPIPLPPQKELQVILTRISRLDKLEKEFGQLLKMDNNIETLKAAILNKAFRGELGTNNLEEESALELLKEVLQEQLNQ